MDMQELLFARLYEVWIEVLFSILGFLFSAFYGLKAMRILGGFHYKDEFYTGKIRGLKKQDLIFFGIVPPKLRTKDIQGEYEWARYTKSHLFHQVWINFIGSIIGWFFMYLFTKHLLITQSVDLSKLGLQYFIAFFIGVLGIMGFLPYTFFSIAGTGASILKSILGR